MRKDGLRSLATNILVALLSTALFGFLLEGGARILEKRRPHHKVADYLWDWEERWEGDFYTVGTDSVGWPPWQEFNSDGFRDRARPREKLEGTYRAVGLGDSVTMGAGIEASEAWPQRLEARLSEGGRPVEVLNVALWGWSTRQEVIAYRRYCRPRRPDVVLLGVCLNDIPELQNNLTRPAPWLKTLFKDSALVRLAVNAEGREIRDVEQLFSEPDSPAVKQAFSLFYSEVRTLRREVEADGATLVVIVVPFRFQVLPRPPRPTAQEAVAAFCAAEGLKCLDVLPELRPLGASGFVDYDHLSAAGSQAVADVVARSGVLGSLPEAPSPAPKTLEALVSSLHDPNPAVRAAAAADLAARGGAAPSAAGALFDALSDGSENVRWNAARALLKLDLPPKEAYPRLVPALRSGDPYVRGFAAWSLGNMGAEAESAVPALIEAARTEEKEGKGAALLALARIGPSARAAVPELIEALQSPHAPCRWNAARALGRIGSRDAVAPLVTALHDPNDNVKVHAARALGKLGRVAAPAVAALESARDDPSDDVDKEAERALKRIRGMDDSPPASRDEKE